jgi:hypothetical protein
VNVYGVTLEFGKQQPPRPGLQGSVPHAARLRVHMSPQHAKILAKLLAKNMQSYEQQLGTLPIPTDLYKELGIEEAW